MSPEEAAFQVQLDADPYDQNARAAFADWLEDRGDPRAAAVRELWWMGWAPYETEFGEWSAGNYNITNSRHGVPDTSKLPQAWWLAVAGSCLDTCGCLQEVLASGEHWASWKTRLACESAVIAAYQPTEVPA